MELLDQIKTRARQLQNRIVLAEGTELRTLKAAEIIINEKLARIILLGNPDKIEEITFKEGINVSGAEIIDPSTDDKRQQYAELMVEIRKNKGLTMEEALASLNDPLVFE